MSSMLYTKGKLKQRSIETQSLLANELSTSPNIPCCNDDGVDVNIVTLKQWEIENCLDRALESGVTPEVALALTNEQLLAQYSTAPVKEFVKINTDRSITIGVHAEIITDEVVDRALSLILLVDNIQPNTRFEFNKAHKLTP